MNEDLLYTFGVDKSYWMTIRFFEPLVLSKPYYFESNQVIKNRTVTSLTNITSAQLGGDLEGFNLFNGRIFRGTNVYLVDSKGNIVYDQYPALLFSNRAGKKVRTNIQVDPERSYIMFNEIGFIQPLPALFALNLTLK
jgi:hypothetical protein